MKLQEGLVIIFKKRFIIFTILSSVLCVGCNAQVEETPIIVETPEITYTREEVKENLAYYEERIFHAENMAAAARALGYPEDSIVIKIANDEILSAEKNIKYFNSLEDAFLAEDLEWDAKRRQHPTATTIWLYLKDLGYNDYVCAGILGNMMAEVGGGTLNLKWDAISYDGLYYGLCQWSSVYSDVWNKNLMVQLDFLRDTIEYEINTFGYAYKRNFDYKSFLLLDDERIAAYAFATCYERCAKQYRSIRQDYAEIAYEYFVGE